ncbi:ankyrin repeat domain-containing protein, partial [Planctomycetota bacterium]
DGDIEQVKLLISKGADVNAEDEKKKTPLCYAVKTGKMELIQMLVESDADVNAGSWPPLCEAVDENNVAIAKYLIVHGADVNAPEGWAALQVAPYVSNNIEMVELLIANGADINAGPYTALHAAVDEDRLDIAEMLIAKGANVNSKDNDGRTPLHLAAESADKDIAEMLLAKGANIHEKDDEYGFTAMHYATRFGSKNIVEFLIAKGADINAKDKNSCTPLSIAVHHDYKVAELLINKGADGNIITDSGQTLLQLVQERKSIESTVPDMIFDGVPNSMLGVRIACGDIDGDGYDDILITRRKYGIENEKGHVYLFYGGADMDTTPDLIFEGEHDGDRFGFVSCGDIDNDGYEDIVIAAIGYRDNRGRAYLYWGNERSSMDADPDKVFDGEAVKGSCLGLGCPGSSIYDIDNDGYRDIIFGAHRDGTGRAYLYYGNTKELIDTSYDLIFTGENPEDQFGFAIGCGDVDNDGYGDIIIGARDYPGSKPSQGRAYLYYGDKQDKMDVKADKIFDAESKSRDWFGQGIVCHDINNDGHDDIVIGAQGYKGRQGRAYLFYGNTRAELDTVPDNTFDGEIPYSDYGFQIVCADIDGDEKSDIIIGADFIRQQVGRVYVYWGSELSGPSPKPGRIFTGENPGEWFSASACGDVNNDGYEDLVIGAHGYKAGSNQGRAYLYYGGPKDK